MISIKDIESSGGFVNDELVAKEGIWERYDQKQQKVVKDSINFFVRVASYKEFKNAIAGIPEGKVEPGEKYDSDAVCISACIRFGDKGQESIPYEKAIRLESGLYRAFMTAIGEVYSTEFSDPKTLPPSKSSGANLSSTASAAKPSRKRKKV